MLEPAVENTKGMELIPHTTFMSDLEITNHLQESKV
jgi:hypothetical protein